MVNYSVSHGNSGEVCTCVCMCVFICTSMMILFWLCRLLCHSVTQRSVMTSRSHIVLRTLSTIIQPHSSVTANDILCLRMLNYILDNIFLYSFMPIHFCLSLYRSTKRLTFFSHMTLFRAK